MVLLNGPGSTNAHDTLMTAMACVRGTDLQDILPTSAPYHHVPPPFPTTPTATQRQQHHSSLFQGGQRRRDVLLTVLSSSTHPCLPLRLAGLNSVARRGEVGPTSR
jgi:hypothetical protein